MKLIKNKNQETCEMKLGIYRHYKGNLYRVIGISRHSETLEEFVVYQALYNDFGLWIRPLSMFCENVVLDGAETPRFTFVQELFTRSSEI